ncbi:MAG: FUSC family protein [Pseudomonadota bacterium]
MGDRLVSLDPGGVRFARGVHALLVIVLAALAASWVGRLAGAPESAAMAIIAPSMGTNAMLLTVPSLRRVEIVSIAKLTGVALAVIALTAIAGWGDWGLGRMPAEIAWVPAIVIGFYLRRYGAMGFRLGMVLSLTFMFVVIFNPGRIDALWWLLAAIIGGLAAMLVSMVAWRPSTTRAFQRQLDRFVVAVIDRLKAVEESQFPQPHHRSVHWAWVRLARTSDMAAGAHPEQRQRLEQTVAAALRMMLALEVVTDDPDGIMGNRGPDSALRRALNDTIETLSSRESDPDAISARVSELRATSDDVVAQRDRPGRERFHEARLMIGLLRILLSYKEVFADPAKVAATPATAPSEKTDGRAGKRLGLRLAVQAAVAASITTAIGIVFELDHSYWATLTVVIVISANLGATVRRTLERVLGTVAGVAAALTVIWLAGNDHTVLAAFIVLAFLPITVVIERHYIVAAGLIGFIIVTGLHMVAGLTDAQMFERIYETAIGAVVALIVAWLLVPIRSVDHAREILQGFRAHCRAALQDALAGKTSEAAAAGRLQKDMGDLAAELTNIQSERLLARGIGKGTRRLQAYADSLAIYIALLATVLERLAKATLPETNKALLNELVAALSTLLETPFDQSAPPVDAQELTDRWAASTKLDGSIPVRDAMWLIEALVYGRKSIETLDGIRTLLVSNGTETGRKTA